MSLITCLLLTWLFIVPAYGQITLTHENFLGLGDSYTALVNATGSLIDISGVIGEPGENAWDFTSFSEPDLLTLTVEYVETSAGDFGGELLFPTATLALQTSANAQGSAMPTVLGYTYLSQDSTGRRIHGSYIHDFPGSPELVYMPALLDPPLPLTLGQTWTTDTSFAKVFDLSGTLVNTSNVVHIEAEVDGFGTITLPGLGILNCLRVQELTTIETSVDIAGTFTPLDTLTTRSYVWFAEGIGEVARITSEVYGTVVPPIGIPPVDFTTAAELQIQIANFQALEDSTLNTR